MEVVRSQDRRRQVQGLREYTGIVECAVRWQCVRRLGVAAAEEERAEIRRVRRVRGLHVRMRFGCARNYSKIAFAFPVYEQNGISPGEIRWNVCAR